jgi:hypothetical protein
MYTSLKTVISKDTVKLGQAPKRPESRSALEWITRERSLEATRVMYRIIKVLDIEEEQLGYENPYRRQMKRK